MCIALMILWILVSCLPALSYHVGSKAATALDTLDSDLLKHLLAERTDYGASKRMVLSSEFSYQRECCPSEATVNSPRGGVARDGSLLELYRKRDTVQKFYQRSCRRDVLNKPCMLVDRKYRHASRCVQRHSYVYAFVRNYNESQNFRLDYIRIKSACSCQLDITVKEELDFSQN